MITNLVLMNGFISQASLSLMNLIETGFVQLASRWIMMTLQVQLYAHLTNFHSSKCHKD